MKKMQEKSQKTREAKLLAKVKTLKQRLADAEETLRAIRQGEVDALIVETSEGDRIYTLAGAEHPYRVMVESMNEGAATLVEDGTIFYCNQRFAEILNTPMERIIGSSIFPFIEPREEKSFKASFMRALRGASKGESVFRAADGHSIPVLLSMSHFPAADIPGSLCLVATDITKRRQAEQALQKSHDELEIRVDKRTADLKVKTEQLEVANRELESFSYSISHDLRAPLRAIDGYSRMILRKIGDTFDEDTKRKFNDIRLNVHMMGQLIDDILAFSRLIRKDMLRSELNMIDLIREVWKELNSINPDRNISLIVNSTPLGYGDAALVKQVYHNLLSNAVKFTKLRDYAQIEVGGYNDGNENVFYVKDNGIGFDMKFYDKLFGVFQRLHNDPFFEGTGVGLATVQRIIHRQGGRVWAEGKVNEGAIFCFTLPHDED
ncbi:MAG TPA: ATP-binding protein [Syntrophales bacterium]|nr:ATP-binding protein [Syntrophales bacterium]